MFIKNVNLTQHPTLLSPPPSHTLVLIFFKKLHNTTAQEKNKEINKFHKNLNQQEFGKKFESEKLVESKKKGKKIINLKLPLGINKMSEENLIKRNLKEEASNKNIVVGRIISQIYATK